MKNKNNSKTRKREIVTVAEAKRSNKKRSTVAPNIQYDRVTNNYIVELYKGIVDGKAVRRHETYQTFKEASDRLTEFKAEKLKGKVPTANSKITMGECMNEFISNAQIARTTERGYRVIEKRVQRMPLYHKKLIAIEFVDIEQYIIYARNNANLKNTTINKDLDFIHRVFEYAIKHKYINDNPVKKIERPKNERFKAQPLSIDELNQFCQCALKDDDWRIIIPVYLGAYQGMRRGEIVGLKWNMISFEDNTINIQETITQMGGEIIKKRPKTENSERVVAIAPRVKEILQLYKDYQTENNIYGEYVVTNADGLPLNPTFVSKKFQEFILKHGLRKIRFHDLRHTYGTQAIANGASALSVSGAMGHSKVSTTLNIYVHSKSLEGSKEVNEKLQKIFG